MTKKIICSSYNSKEIVKRGFKLYCKEAPNSVLAKYAYATLKVGNSVNSFLIKVIIGVLELFKS